MLYQIEEIKNKIIHYDLFSGIGGFSYALDQVYGKENIKHIFVENDDFCIEVLKKHWPEAEYYGDIRTFTYTKSGKFRRQTEQKRGKNISRRDRKVIENTFSHRLHIQEVKKYKRNIGDIGARDGKWIYILTGGFPCQPFSQAGVRKGTSDERYLWPEMFRVISEIKPDWIIAENVAGLLTIQNGLVFEQICTDLESEGYEVQAFIIPACAVGAPHRRDRVWIVAHTSSERCNSRRDNWEERYLLSNKRSTTKNKQEQQKRECGVGTISADTSNSTSERLERGEQSETSRTKPRQHPTKDSNAQNSVGKRGRRWVENSRQVLESKSSKTKDARSSWEENWIEVAARLCRVDDGLPTRMDRNPRLKALGNAIVPQVAKKIFEGIKQLTPANY